MPPHHLLQEAAPGAGFPGAWGPATTGQQLLNYLELSAVFLVVRLQINQLARQIERLRVLALRDVGVGMREQRHGKLVVLKRSSVQRFQQPVGIQFLRVKLQNFFEQFDAFLASGSFLYFLVSIAQCVSERGRACARPAAPR